MKPNYVQNGTTPKLKANDQVRAPFEISTFRLNNGNEKKLIRPALLTPEYTAPKITDTIGGDDNCKENADEIDINY